MSIPKSPPSPIDAIKTSDKLLARVVKPGWQPLLHGYDVQADLAHHFSFEELILCALIGEAPDAMQARCFAIGLIFAAPISIAEAPSHAASLARLCGAEVSGVLATGSVTLSEQVRWQMERHRPLLAWLRGEVEELEAVCCAESDEEREAVGRLRLALRKAGVELPWLERDLSLWASVLSTLFHAGLVEEWQLSAALFQARVPALAAEAMAATPGQLREYPIRLPKFEYAKAEYSYAS